MAQDWMDDLIRQDDQRRSEASEKRQQQLIRHKALTEVAVPIWQQLEERLLNRVDAFNARRGPRGSIRVLPKSDDFMLKLKCRGMHYAFVVRFAPEAGAITYGAEHISGGKLGWLTVKADGEAPYAVEINLPGGETERLPIETLDEVVLKDLFEQILNETP